MKKHYEDLKGFYESFDDVIGYYLIKKEERLNTGTYQMDMSRMYNHSLHPNDMDISIEEITHKDFTNNATMFATFPIENQIGRRMLFGVKENNTNTYIGFIRLSSPVLSIKPRNEYFGCPLDNKKVNKHFYNGSVIVPVQPFGYNYLGGKLISLICLSNEVREMFNKKYNTNIVVFETTSLYGNSKPVSMYDGMKSYIKYYGNTQSKNLLTPTDDLYIKIRDEIRKTYGKEEYNGCLTNPKGSTPKSREFNKMIQIIKQNLIGDDLMDFKDIVDNRMKTIEQKRYYMSFMGFENVKEHILNDEELIRNNTEKYDLNNLIEYWKRKATNRFEKLKKDCIFREQLEYYSSKNIKQKDLTDIIR